MKSVWILPFALLLGLIIGGWAPKRDLRTLQAEMDALRSQAASAPKDSQLDMFTRMAKIPERATRKERRPVHPRPPVENQANAPTPAEPAAIAKPAPEKREKTPERMNPEDLQARINEAKELWKTRVDVARAQWINRLKLSTDQTAVFDETINSMNEQLYLSMQRLADTLETSDTVTPETGIRTFNEMTETLVQTYDALGTCVPDDQQGETGKIELTDFIDPAITEPLIAVQDKLDKLPKQSRPVVRIGR